jgi:hypothetical protein
MKTKMLFFTRYTRTILFDRSQLGLQARIKAYFEKSKIQQPYVLRR